MRQALGTDGLYLNASLYNLWAGDALKGAQEAAGVWAFPGLIHPEAISWSTSGLNVTGVFSYPFKAQFASASSTSGIVAGAHGTTVDADTQTYIVNLASLVPGAGSQTVYIAASYTTVQQTPTAVVGAPPGNAAFNPNFSPFLASVEQVDTISVFATTGAVDGLTTLELARTTLSAGQSSISLAALDFSHQQAAAHATTFNQGTISGTTTLTPSQVGTLWSVQGSGYAITLPSAASFPGRSFFFIGNVTNSTSYVTIQTNGADEIWSSSGPSATTSAIGLRQGQCLEIFAQPGGGNLFARTHSGDIPLTWPVTGAAPPAMAYSASGDLTVPRIVTATDPGAPIGGVVINGTTSVGANLKLAGNGVTTPTKWIRTLNGFLQIINSAYTTVLAFMDDSGNLTTAESITANSGNITAAAGYARAALGATQNPSDGNLCPILNDFSHSNGSYSAYGYTQAWAYTRQPDGALSEGLGLTVPQSSNTYAFSLPAPLTTFGVPVCSWGGTDPPSGSNAPGLSVAMDGLSAINITLTNVPAGITNPFAVNVVVIGI